MPFQFVETSIPDLTMVLPRVFEDERGFFMESYKASDFLSAGITERFVQDNHSRSRKNVIRGLHFQREPHRQGKLVRCVSGTVWDVAVDLRRGSPTYGRWKGVLLSAENKTMLYLPPGFAHGFAVLSESADVLYKASEEYAPESDGGIAWNDPSLGIKWPIAPEAALVSEKDRRLPRLKELEEPYL
jgi:dTDP-4-dehydrorhamnose 3,5-epimerase